MLLRKFVILFGYKHRLCIGARHLGSGVVKRRRDCGCMDLTTSGNRKRVVVKKEKGIELAVVDTGFVGMLFGELDALHA